MNGIGASILCIVIIVVLLAPRRWALFGMMGGVLYLPEAQQIQVAGFILYAFRFVELAGFVRVISRGEFKFGGLSRIDRTFLMLYAYTTAVFLVRSNQDQAYQIGVAVDAFLCYFTFRGLVCKIEDLHWFLRAFLILLIPYVALVLLESVTNNNPFSAMGVSMRNSEDWFRNGRIRCQGSFRHPSLLGTLGASFLPLYIGLLLAKAERKLAIVGIVLCLAIIWASNSGGPISCAGAGMAGWLLWKSRTRMQLLRRFAAGVLVFLALVMKAPVWYLLQHISDVTGGDGWHRSELIDQAYRHLDQWWLAGMSIADTHDWLPYAHRLTGGVDMTNQFLDFAINAGFVAMGLFIVLVVRAFQNLGSALLIVRSKSNKTGETEYLLWGLGAMLAGHIFNWLGITYFDQFHAVWFMQLAVITSLTESCIQPSNVSPMSGANELDDIQ